MTWFLFALPCRENAPDGMTHTGEPDTAGIAVSAQKSDICRIGPSPHGVESLPPLRRSVSGAPSYCFSFHLPTFIPQLHSEEDEVGKDNLPNGKQSPFSEGLLRDILELTQLQQLELCTDLVAENINKNKFTTRSSVQDFQFPASATMAKMPSWIALAPTLDNRSSLWTRSTVSIKVFGGNILHAQAINISVRPA
jgi:hypothetical protein